MAKDNLRKGDGMNQIDEVYAERNQVVALLANTLFSIGFSVGIRKTEIEGWDPEWHNCVFIDLPTGQISWHYHDREASLFERLPPYEKPWDGHTTELKYLRMKDCLWNYPVPMVTTCIST